MIARKIAVHNRLLPINCCLGASLEDWLVDEFLVLGLFPELDAARRRPGRFQHRRFRVVGPRLAG